MIITTLSWLLHMSNVRLVIFMGPQFTLASAFILSCQQSINVMDSVIKYNNVIQLHRQLLGTIHTLWSPFGNVLVARHNNATLFLFLRHFLFYVSGSMPFKPKFTRTHKYCSVLIRFLIAVINARGLCWKIIYLTNIEREMKVASLYF